MMKMCETINTSPPIQEDTGVCFLTRFDRWLKKAKKLAVPVNSKDFMPLLKEWNQTDHDTFNSIAHSIGVIKSGGKHDGPERVSWVKTRFYITATQGARGYDLLPVFEEAEQLIQGFNNDPARPKTAGIAFQTSDAWVSMYTDITAISGTGFSIVAMAITAFLAIFVFTANLRVSVATILSISG